MIDNYINIFTQIHLHHLYGGLKISIGAILWVFEGFFDDTKYEVGLAGIETIVIITVHRSIRRDARVVDEAGEKDFQYSV